MCFAALLSCDVLRTFPVSSSPPESGRRSAEEELRSLLASTKAQHILKDFDKLAEFQMPVGRKGRKGLLREEHRTECEEVDAPPDVTQVVSQIGPCAA